MRDVSRIVVQGADEARKLLGQLTGRELSNRVRRGMRAGAKVFRTAYRAEAKGRSDLPDSFAKTDTRNHRNLSVSTGPQSPLINIFEPGAGSHTIAPGKLQGSGRRAMLLSGRAGARGRSRAFVASGPVQHPGMEARPSLGPVFDREQDDATEAALETIVSGLR